MNDGCALTRADRRLCWWWLCCAFGILLLGSHGYIENLDAEVEYQTARALWLRGDPGLSATAADASAGERLIVTTPNPFTGRPGFDVMQGRGGKSYSWFGIGHAALEAPLYGLGRLLGRWWPDVEQRYLQSTTAQPLPPWPPIDDFWSRFCVSLLSPWFGALTAGVLLLLARSAGAPRGVALLAAAAALFCGQLWPQSRESLSDTQAGFFFLLAVLGGMRWWLLAGVDRRAARWWIALAGAAAGMAVLTRVQHAVGLLLLGAVGCLWAARHRRLGDLLVAASAGAPFAVFFLWFNWWRFGNPLELGYGVEAAGGFWSFDPLQAALLLWSPCKGVFWFTPTLWLGFLAWRRCKGERARGLLAVAGLLFVAAWIPPSLTHGWHSGWTWGCRFLTPVAVLGSVLCLAVLRLRGYWLAATCVLGFCINLGGVLSPVHGFLKLAFASAPTAFPGAQEQHLQDHVFFQPMYSPIHGHWIYLCASTSGALASADPALVHGPFGWPYPSDRLPPLAPEDFALRHLWYINGEHRLGTSARPFAWGLLLLTAMAAGLAVVHTRAGRPPPPPP